MQIRPGTRVILTGASRGIGESLARALAARGCEIGLMARSADDLERLAASLDGDGHQVLVADVADRAAVEEAVRSFGPADVLLANAGVAHYGPYSELTVEREEQMMQVNVMGTLHLVRAALPEMVKRGSGQVVVVASGAAVRTFPGAAVYGATKAAQRGFAEALRHELDGTGVSVTVVYPGEIRSHLHDHEKERMPDWYRTDDTADPDDLARAVVAGIEDDDRGVYFPSMVRLLRIMHGVSPRLADTILRRMRGKSVAPRK